MTDDSRVTYGGVLPRSSVRPLPPISTVTLVARYRWPDERHLIPARCRHCTGAVVVSDVPTADHPLADVACLLCSRVVCELIHGSARPRMTRERFAALPVSQGKRTRGPEWEGRR